MKMKYIALFFASVAASLMGCSSEIEDGTSNLDKLPDVVSYTLTHPCMLHLETDFSYVKSRLGQSPWSDAWEHLQNSKYANTGYVAEPVEVLKRMDYNNWHATYPDYNNFEYLMRDAAAAYQLALCWKLSGNEDYAMAAVRILNAWADKCTGILKISGKGWANDIPDPNEYLISIQVPQLANAAEILRDYAGWNSTDFTAFKSWMVDTFYKMASLFLSNHHNSSDPQYTWLNWDLAQMNSILSIGILCDDSDKINEAILYFKNGIGNGQIDNAVPFLHKDPDSNETLGQCQESGRDQGHATLCVSLMGIFCQMAYNIGEDLFAYKDYKAVRMAEYVAKYNLYKDESWASGGHADGLFQYSKNGFPYPHYTNNSWDCPTLSSQESNDASRGDKRPCWELFYGYCKQKGISSVYCRKQADQMRTLSSIKCDGGAGDYGDTSGGFDQIGYGTLMHYRN